MRRLLECGPHRLRAKRMMQLAHMLGGMPAGRRELARLAMPLMDAPPLFDLRLMPVELLLALGE